MPSVVATGLAVSVALGAVILVGAAVTLDPAGLSVDVLLLALALLVMAAVGALLAIRVPRNAIGWLLLVSAVLLDIEFLAAVYAGASERYAAGSWPGTLLAVWLYGNLLTLPFLITVIGIPLIFPDGRLISPRWRWMVALLVVVGAGEVLKWFRVGLIPDTNVENPFGIAAIEPFLRLITMPPFQALGAVVLLSPIACVAIRYRGGAAIERAQLRWLIAATVMAVAAWSVVAISGAVGAAMATTLGWYFGLLAFSAMPLAIGIAVLRYRLYEIDRIISRTIGWAVVTSVLFAVFALGVVALQWILSGVTQGGTLAVAGSTLIALVLFQPLRRRVHRAVDRRFDRARFDQRRTVETLADRLRDEVALGAVIADLQETVDASFRPSSYALWLRATRPRPRPADFA